MKKTVSRILSLLMAFVFAVLTLSTTAYAYTENPGYFDFGDCVVSVDAGGSKSVTLQASYDYVYHMGPHTSKLTYCECKQKKGTETIVFHVGPDETEKNVFFYFYIKDDSVKEKEIFDTIEVYVQKINKDYAANTAAADALKSYSGNSASFNAFYYYMNYPDLRAAFGTNGDALLNHYNTFGINEKRVANKFK